MADPTQEQLENQQKAVEEMIKNGHLLDGLTRHAGWKVLELIASDITNKRLAYTGGDFNNVQAASCQWLYESGVVMGVEKLMKRVENSIRDMRRLEEEQQRRRTQ